jgi:hypothetical protein
VSGSAEALTTVPPSVRDAADVAPAATAPLAWSLWAASGLIALLVALVVGSGLVIAAGTAAGVRDADLAAVSVGLLTAAYATVICITWMLARASESDFWPAVGARRVPMGTLVFGALMATAVGRGAAAVWELLLSSLDIELAGADVDPTRIFPSGPMGVALAVLVVVVLAPVAEEVVFRGVLLPSLERHWGARVAVIGSSVLFALMHVTPYAIVPIFVFALILGGLFVRTRSLTVCIAAHAVFNATGLAALYVAKSMGLL